MFTLELLDREDALGDGDCACVGKVARGIDNQARSFNAIDDRLVRHVVKSINPPVVEGATALEWFEM